MLQDIWWNLRESGVATRERVDGWLLGRRHALMAAAACRIGTGLSVLGLLLSNFSTRDIWVGQGSVWAQPARAVSRFPEIAVLRNVSGDVLTLVYVVTILAALAFVLGWRTKAANVVTFVGFIAIVGQNPVVGTQGDNLVRLTLLWLLLMRTGDSWSLDARRRAKIADSGDAGHAWNQEALPAWLSTGLHNIGLFALGAQTILVYMAGGLDKISQSVWQHGTALYYTMQLPEYRPFPGLSDLLSGGTVILAVLTYTTLCVQLFFGPLLLHPVARRIVVTLAIALSVVFAVIFAAPWNSLATIAVTGLFISDRTYLLLGERLAALLAPVVDRLAEAGYVVLDRLDDLRYRFILPVVDWIAVNVFRR
jgi:hypothetical protein